MTLDLGFLAGVAAFGVFAKMLWDMYTERRRRKLIKQEVLRIAPIVKELNQACQKFAELERSGHLVTDTPDEFLSHTIMRLFGNLSDEQYGCMFDRRYARKDCIDRINTSQKRILKELPWLLEEVFENTWLLRGNRSPEESESTRKPMRRARTKAAQEKAAEQEQTTANSSVKKRTRITEAQQVQAEITGVVSTFNHNLIPDGAPEVGPSVTRYYFRIPEGVRLSKITALSDDIALSMGVQSVRIAPVHGRQSVIGIEVPNKKRTLVTFSEIIKSEEFQQSKSPLAFAIGKDISGKSIVGNLDAMPHLLIAGTTGSGKSVCENTLICSILAHSSPECVKFIMIDPKMVELAPYNGIPHLMKPVITDVNDAADALNWTVKEMENRYKAFSESGIKKVDDCKDAIPYLVIVIDEMADLMTVAGKEVETSIIRLAQMGRAAGIHLVLTTQRPTADVVTGLIKANVPSRIAFAVSSAMESRIILDDTGAETLAGHGDMLYAPQGGEKTRIQGCFISEKEIRGVIRQCKKQG